MTRRGGYKTNKDRRRYRLMVNGDLCVWHLKESDHGRYRCNQQLVAELQVLTGMLGVEPPGWVGGKQIINAGKDEEQGKALRQPGRPDSATRCYLLVINNRTEFPLV